jgi:hypothetical protein
VVTIEPEPTPTTTDDEPVAAVEPQTLLPTDDPEAPEPDALEQAIEVDPGERLVAKMPDDPEVPEADVIEQRMVVAEPDEAEH